MTPSKRRRKRETLQRSIDDARAWLDALERALDAWVVDPTPTRRWRSMVQMSRFSRRLERLWHEVTWLDCERRDP